MNRGVLIVLLLASCGTAPVEEVGWTSGSRLRARVWRSPDGARAFIGWHDLQLGVDCTLELAADGVIRCLPVTTNGAIAYLDATCTTPILLTPSNEPIPRFANQRVAVDECRDGIFTFSTGSALEPRPATHYVDVGGGDCREMADEPTVEYFAIEPAASETFVEVEEVHRSNGPLTNVIRVAEDGAREWVRAIDTATGAQMYGDDRWNFAGWFPESYSSFDLSCDGSVGCRAVTAAACEWTSPVAPFVWGYANDTVCGGLRIAYYERAAPTPTECTPADLVCFMAGAEVSRDEFPAMTEVLVGTGRLRTRFDGVEEGGAVRQSFMPFFDSELDTPCGPRFIGGARRCVPDGNAAPLPDVFREWTCQDPLGYLWTPGPDESCDPPRPRFVYDIAFVGSESVLRLYELSDAVDTTELAEAFVRDSFHCFPYDSATYPGTVYGLSEMAAEDFVTLEEVIE